MTHTSLKIALLRFSATMLLFMGTIPAMAQYYLNVFHKNGTRTAYLVSDLDSVTFTEGSTPVINPAVKKNVSKISCTYVENYPTTAEIDNVEVAFKYDNLNRVVSLTSNDGTAQLVYSKAGSIIVTTLYDTVTYNLDNSGLVSNIVTKNGKEVYEYDGGYASKITNIPLDEDDIFANFFNIEFKHNNGVLTNITLSNKSGDIPYRFNYDTPLINVDLNWFIFYYGGGIEYAPMWLGYGGKLSDKLFEFPIFSYSLSSPNGELNTSEPGTFHYESKYNQLNPWTISNLAIEKDDEGCPIKITYTINVEEYVYSYDYIVDSDHRWEIVDGTTKDEPTGNIVGTNVFVYSFEYSNNENTNQSTTYEYVDLGLSVKWATCNVGANSPEEYGDYFAWGETEPYYETGYAQEDPQTHWIAGKTGYSWSSYKYCNGLSSTLTKYNTNSKYGTIDNKTTLDPADDVAHVKWGGSWRMPTQTEINELRNGDNCTWTSTSKNGINGYLVTSKKSGYEGCSIFLPSAGGITDGTVWSVGDNGCYWSSSLKTAATWRAMYLNFSSDDNGNFGCDRHNGLSVRPVLP